MTTTTHPAVADQPFDHAPEGVTRTGERRIIGLDVTRGLALIGVAVMNYHGYLNGGQTSQPPTFFDRLFHPWNGVLSTRFAATFVLVAGMGITLLTNRSRRSGDKAAVRADRWRLARRGLLLYAGGYVLEWIWSGTILFFYGAYFLIAAFLFTLRTRWIAAIGVASALAGAGIAAWRAVRLVDGDGTGWLDPNPDTPRNLLLRTFVGHTHPVLPWLAFLCAGLIIGRALHRLAALRPWLILGGAAAVAITYSINSIASPPLAEETTNKWVRILSTRPFDRGLLYTIGTLGSSIIAFCVISWLAEQFRTALPIVAVQRAGQLTLTLYVLHVLMFNLIVNRLGWVQPFSLGAALGLAAAFWVCAIALGAWWQRLFGQGPLERLYRGFGG